MGGRRGGGARGALLGEQDVGAVDEDRGEEPAIADLAGDALRVGQRGLGADRIAGQQLGLGVEHGHPDRGLVQPEVVQAVARAGELVERAARSRPPSRRARRRSRARRARRSAARPRWRSSSSHSARASATGTRLTTSAQAMTLTPASSSTVAPARRAKRRGVAGFAQAALRAALQPGELAHQVARPRDADVVAERLERHGGVLRDDERRAGVHRLGVAVGAHALALDLAAQAHPIAIGGPPPRRPPPPPGPGCRPRTARRPWPAAARRGRRPPAPGAPARARGRRSPTAGRRARAPRRGRGEPCGGPVREILEPLGRQAQLARGAPGPLQLRADARARLGHRDAHVREPSGQPLVRVRARGQRHRGVRGVADERVPEAERALTGDEREGGAHELALDSSSSARPTGRPGSGTSASSPPTWKVSPSMAPASITRRSVAPRVSRRAASSACSAGGRGPASLRSRTWAASCSRNSGLPCARATTPLERRGGQRRPGVEQAAAGLLVQRGGRRTAPRAQAGRAVSSSGRPTHSSSTGAAIGPPASWSMRSSRAGSAQCASSKASTSARAGGERGEEHPEGPRRGVGGGLPAEPERRRDRRRRPAPFVGRRHDRGQRAPAQRLQHHLAQRPVGDAVAVGRAVPDEHLRIGPGARGELAHEPRLADPGLADEGQQLHAPRVAHPRERGRASAASSRSRPASGVDVGVARAGGVEQRLHRRAQSSSPGGGVARQPRGRADHVAGRQGIAVGHQRGARRSPRDGRRAQRRLALELGQPALERGRGPDGAQALVLVARPVSEHGRAGRPGAARPPGRRGAAAPSPPPRRRGASSPGAPRGPAARCRRRSARRPRRRPPRAGPAAPAPRARRRAARRAPVTARGRGRRRARAGRRGPRRAPRPGDRRAQAPARAGA